MPCQGVGLLQIVVQSRFFLARALTQKIKEHKQVALHHWGSTPTLNKNVEDKTALRVFNEEEKPLQSVKSYVSCNLEYFAAEMTQNKSISRASNLYWPWKKGLYPETSTDSWWESSVCQENQSNLSTTRLWPEHTFYCSSQEPFPYVTLRGEMQNIPAGPNTRFKSLQAHRELVSGVCFSRCKQRFAILALSSPVKMSSRQVQSWISWGDSVLLPKLLLLNKKWWITISE